MDAMNEPIGTTQEKTGFNGPTTSTSRTGRETRPREGRTTSMTENVTGRVPSIAYLAAAVGAMGASAVLQVMGKEKLSLFVGQWAPSLLVIGLYNKVVKVAGND